MALKQEQRFQDPIFIDSLTGLFNRYFLYQALPELIRESGAFGLSLGILMFDIDNFKNINDTYGHLKGDLALKEVARVLKSCTREDDEALRYAGDEFIVIFKVKETSSPFFEVGAKRIIEEISKLVILTEDEVKFSLSVSGGLAIYPNDGQDLEKLIDAADKALYLSKEKGKNRLSLAQEAAQKVITQEEALRLFPCAKFINRSVQMEGLKKTLEKAMAGRVYFVLVKGKLGVGKTRLLDEFKKDVESQAVFLLKIDASLKHTLQPFYALSKALEDFLKKDDLLLSAIAASLSGPEIKALANLIPVFKKFTPELSSVGAGEERAFLFKGFRSICVELSCAHGLFLYFDEVQWLDKATFDLLNYLVSDEFIRPILICASLEEEELKEDLPAKEFLVSLKPKDNFILWELMPFLLQETRELLLNIFPHIEPSPEFLASLQEITAGNILFIEEMLKYLVESGMLFYKDNQWQMAKFSRKDIPSSLEGVLQQRLKKLDPETKEMLAKAVVLGKDFEAELLRRTIKSDQGYLFELLDRARKKSFINPKDNIGSFNFITAPLQKLIYGQMQSGQRSSLHQEAARLSEEIYRDSPQQGVLGDLVYHYEKLGDVSKIAEYKDKLKDASAKVFNPQELQTYLEGIFGKGATEIEVPASLRIEKIDRELTEEETDKVIELIRFIFAAIKNIGFYPAGNKIREASVQKVEEILREVLHPLSSLTFWEVEKILLINNKRLGYQKEKASLIKDFVELMIERDIKGIQLLSFINKEGLVLFLELLAQNPEGLRRGQIVQLLKEKGLQGVRIDAASYQRVGAQERMRPFTEKVNKIMLMDFLLGPAKEVKPAAQNFLKALEEEPQNLARQLKEIASSLQAQEGKSPNPKEEADFIFKSLQRIEKEVSSIEAHPASQAGLRKLILSLDEGIKSQLFSRPDAHLFEEKGLMQNLSDDEIMEIILGAWHLPEKERLSNARGLFSRFAASLEQRERMSPVLSKRLKNLGLSESEVSFVTQKKYEGLSFAQRLDMLLKLSPQSYSSLGEESIQNLLKELIQNIDKDSLMTLLRYLLGYLEKGEAEAKEAGLKLMGWFLSLVSCHSLEFDLLVEEVVSGVSKEFPRIDTSLYPAFLKVVTLAMDYSYKGVFGPLVKERWVMRRRFGMVETMLSALFKALEVKEKLPEAEEAARRIKEFIAALSESPLIDGLALELNDPFLDYTNMIEAELFCLGKGCLKRLLKKVLEGNDFSCEGYLYRKKVAGLLKKMGSEGLDEIARALGQETDPLKLRQLIEISGFISEKRLLDALRPLAGHKEYGIREALILALAHSPAEPLTKELLFKLSQDETPAIRALAKEKLKDNAG